MATWLGYFIVTRNVDNINGDNWVLLVDELDEIVGVDAQRYPQNINRNRGIVIDRFNHGTEEIPIWYSNRYIFAAKFNESAVSFEEFRNRLVDLFEVPDHKVTYTTATQTHRYQPSVTATYDLNDQPRITVELLGRAADDQLCTTEESRQEGLQCLDNDKVAWGEER